MSIFLWHQNSLAQDKTQDLIKPEINSNKLSSNDTIRSVELIHFGDLIDVDVIGSSEFDWRGTLTPEGFLNGIDFVDEPIYALCKTEGDVAKAIAKGFEKILRNPQVEVKILDKSGRAISYLYGAVKNQHRFNIQRIVRLNELIIISGGLEERASGEIQIYRSNRLNCRDLAPPLSGSDSVVNREVSDKHEDSQIINIKIIDLIKGVKDANPVILNGDIITIGMAEPIYVIGGVNNPRQINARLQMTLSRAISSAGGFSKNADSARITVYRRNRGEASRIEVDFSKIESKESEDHHFAKI